MGDVKLPQGYYILDGEEEPHDADMEDGRYCLYSPDDEPLANLHDAEELILIAIQHSEALSGPVFDPELVTRLTEAVRAIEAGEVQTIDLTGLSDTEVLNALLGDRD